MSHSLQAAHPLTAVVRCGYSGGHIEKELGVRAIGVREFRDHATSLLAAGETLVIERHGEAIGFYVPIQAKDRRTGLDALGRLGAIVGDVLERSGLDEEELIREVLIREVAPKRRSR
jgi:antitoxin (DNA-binding transcriptional repressor) of toxin-antitoxin stability system